MPTKPSAYQKLKAENLKLRQDIHTILLGKDAIQKWSVETRWTLMFKLEEAVWAGEPSARK